MSEQIDREAFAARAELCRRSLRRFVDAMWPLIERRPFVSNWHIEVVCEHLEAVSAGELLRLLINVPPRTTKSTVVAVMWPAWEWLVAPETQFLCASYSDRLAVTHSLKCRRLIQSVGLRTATGDVPWARRVGYRGLLSLLGQEWELSIDEALKTRFSNTETGVRAATSIGGTITGEGGDRLVIDDPLKASDARSEAVRTAANSWFDDEWSSRLNSPDSSQVVVMQRLHEKDLTGHLIEKGGWHHLCLPAEYEPSHPFVYPGRVELPSGLELAGDPRTVEGELLDPVRLPPRRLKDLKRDQGSYGYAGQYQQRPAPAEGGMFKKHWWRRWTAETLRPFLFEFTTASWDMRFSDSQKASTSYVVGQVWGCHGADRFLLAQVRARLSFTQTLKAVLALAAWRPDITAHLVERKANGAAVIDTLRSRVAGLIPIEPEGGKDVRAAAVQPLVEAGNVYLPGDAVIPCPPGFEPTTIEDFIAEHASFPAGAHDDQVDAMSQALNWLRGRDTSALPERPEGRAAWTHHDWYEGGNESPPPRSGSITGDLLNDPM